MSGRIAKNSGFGQRAGCCEFNFISFYPWLKEPLSHRAQKDIRETEMIRQALADSGKVNGYRKLTDDLRHQGDSVSENRLEQQFQASSPNQVWITDITYIKTH